MEKIHLQNDKIKEKRLVRWEQLLCQQNIFIYSQEVDADEQKFATEQAEAKKRQEAQARIQSDVNKERQKIAEKKEPAQPADSGKTLAIDVKRGLGATDDVNASQAKADAVQAEGALKLAQAMLEQAEELDKARMALAGGG